MSSNSSKMTLEEKLVQHIKTIGLGLLIEDEDAITELTKRAIEEALIQPIRVQKDYGGWDTKDSIVVATAKDVVRKAADQLVEILLKELLEREDVKTAVREAFAAALPAAILDFSAQRVSYMAGTILNDANARLQSVVVNNHLNPPSY